MSATAALVEVTVNTSSYLNQYRSILIELFKNLGYDRSQEPAPEDPQLLQNVKEAFRFNDLSTTYYKDILRPIQIGYDFTNIAYRHVPAEVRLYIAIYTSLTVYMDEGTVTERVKRLQGFAEKLVKNEPQRDPHHDHFARHIAYETCKLFGPYATSCIIKSSIDFLAATGVEFQYPNGFPALADQLPGWFRRKSGDGEAYAFFLFPNSIFPEHDRLGDFLAAIPEIAEWIDIVNDILSFYKERVVGNEENCYIANNANFSGITELESLAATATRAVTLNDRIVAVLSPYENFLLAWKDFQNGYILFHFSQKRYKLHEVFQGHLG